MIRGGNSYVSSAPAFSNDGKSLLVCSSNTVSVFSTSTGLQVFLLEGHMALVTAVIVVPASSPKLCYCWTASLDGTIRYWDFAGPELIRTVNIGLPIFSMVIPSLLGHPAESNAKQSDIFAYISTEENKELDNALCGRIRKCNLTKSRLVGGLILKETQQPELITLSPSGKLFGIRHDHNLYIWKVPTLENKGTVVEKMTLHHTRTFSVIAFHPSGSMVAAGDASGRILIWRGVGNGIFSTNDKLGHVRLIENEEERPGVRGDDDADMCTTWHWHSDEVNVLSFSSDGAHLYSGGKEGVLVVWQIDTGKKRFLPRIGSPLLYFTLSPDPLFASISCADNQFHLLKMPSMEILKSISGIKLPCSLPEMYKGRHSGYAFDRNSGLVALRTANYCVQFYSLFDDRGVFEVQVCERNHQPGDYVTVVVTHVALSEDGSFMSTAEVKLPEDGLGGLVCLKFWSLGSQDKKFSLSTIVYEPHRDSPIFALAFHPTSHMVVSASSGEFKIWVDKNEFQPEHQMLQSSEWICHAVGSYRKKKMTAAAFSSDGSVLAVAAGTVITLWDPYNNVLVAVIGNTHWAITAITTLSFVGEYLVSASKGTQPQLIIWSMSKLSECWSYKLHVEAMACALDSSSFAVLALLPETTKTSNSLTSLGRDGVILLFDVKNPVPVATWTVSKANGGTISFLKDDTHMSDGKPSQALLAYVNSNHEYVLFNPYSKEVDEEVNVSRREDPVTFEETGKFGYASIYGELAEFDPKRKQITDVPAVASERPWETIFSGSSHNLPPLTKLCSAFLESLLEKRTVVVE